MSFAASFYLPASETWTAPRRFRSTLGQPAATRLAVDRSGNVFLALVEFDNWAYHLRASRYEAAAGGWSDLPVDVSVPLDTSQDHELRVVMDAEGNALVAWSDGVGTTQAVRWGCLSR